MGSPVSHSSSGRQTNLLGSPESTVFGGEEALLGLGYKDLESLRWEAQALLFCTSLLQGTGFVTGRLEGLKVH